MNGSSVRFRSLLWCVGFAAVEGWAVLACSSDGGRGAGPSAPEEASEREPGTGSTATGALKPSPPTTSRDPDPKPKPPKVDLYDPRLIPDFELTLGAAAIATLSSEVAEEQKTWVHGSFRFGDITYADVGVRTKGSGTYGPLPQKASLKIKFNKFVKGQKLHGLEEVTLNNGVDDPNYLRQRMSYHVFRAMDLPAPLANSARLRINGEDYGLYANIETPDEEFVERAFGDSVHTLYEAHTPGTWLPGSARRWEIDIEHPTAAPGTKPDLDALFEAVAAARDATLLADLEPHLHTTQWLRFCATEAILGLFDGYSYSKYGPHNYFMAGDTSGRFMMVPWSTDDSLDVNSPVDASMPAADIVFARCKNTDACWSAYKSEMQSALSVYETLGLVELARAWHDQIDSLARADPKREQSIEQYERATDRLYEFLERRPAVIRGQLGL